MSRKTAPCLYVIAGPNGSGKTTFARRFLPYYARCQEFVNADLIAAGISPFHPETAAIQAGRLMLSRIHRLAKQHADFAFETTLSGRSNAGFFRKLRLSGYRIHLFYLWIPSVQLALKRIAERVKAGGHDIPRTVVARRFGKSIRNLFGAYWPLADSISLIDNSGHVPRLIAFKLGGVLQMLDPGLFQKLKESTHAKER
ncbi:MAG: zeta toxin family protein [Elusimicrobia bacterium]|nr:zeta toxin family protein [Elusimicrobiota bacterium]